MTKTSIKTMLKTSVKGAELICKNELMKCMGWGDGHASRMLRGLDCIRISHTKYYSVDEVAESISGYIE